LKKKNVFEIYFIRKYIEIDIFDDEDYQKNELFYVELGHPEVEKSPGIKFIFVEITLILKKIYWLS